MFCALTRAYTISFLAAFSALSLADAANSTTLLQQNTISASEAASSATLLQHNTTSASEASSSVTLLQLVSTLASEAASSTTASTTASTNTSTTVSPGEFDYCSLNCGQPEPRNHTLCGDTFPAGGGVRCKAFHFGLSAEAKRALLAKHNEARQKIASGNEKGYPSAANMMMLTWHDECATVAQRWADQCPPLTKEGTYDTCSRLQGGPVGQNLYWEDRLDNDTAAMEAAMNQWYYEAAPNFIRYNYTINSGHFTQLAWALTAGLGCGLRKRQPNAAGKHRYYLVCNYFPAGNREDAKIYRMGKPCSQCQEGTKCSEKYPALCTRRGTFDVDSDGTGSWTASALVIVSMLMLFILNYN